MANLSSRVEFRTILKRIVCCLQESFAYPDMAPLTSEQVHFWLQEITLEDIRAVMSDIDLESRKTASG